MPTSKTWSSAPLVLLALLFCSAPIVAQRLPLRLYTSADGMASSVIHHIARDSRGYLWFSARGGLSRWDGNNFVKYRVSDDVNTGLVHFFLETRDGTYWISTDVGLFRVKLEDMDDVVPETEPLTPGERSLNAKKVSNTGFLTLFEDRAGKLWAGLTEMYALDDLAADEIKVTPIAFRPPNTEYTDVRGIMESADGSLWLAHSNGVSRRLSDGTFVSYSVPTLTKTQGTFAVRVDQKGLVWFSHTTGVFILNPGTQQEAAAAARDETIAIDAAPISLGLQGEISLPTIANTMVRVRFDGEGRDRDGVEQLANPIAEDLFHDDEDRTWLPSQKSLYIIEKGKYRRLTDNAVRMGTGRRLVKDLEGNLWIGTFAGAFRYSPSGLISYDEPAGLEEPVVHSIQATPDGAPMVFHGTWFASRFVDGLIETKQFAVDKGSRYLWTSRPLFQDAQGKIWALTVAGLYRFDSGLDRPPTLVDAPEIGRGDRSFYRAFSDRKGNSWFVIRGVNDVALFKFDPKSNSWTDISALDGYPKNKAVSALAEDYSGNIWFGFYQHSGLFKLSSGVLTEFKIEDGVPGGSMFGMKFDQRGRLWLGTVGSGVTRIDNPHAERFESKNFTEADGVTSNNIRDIEEGLDGAIYAATIRGVTRIDPETDEVSRITMADGLAADFVHDVFCDSSGTIWFGTANGLSRYTPRPAAALTDPKVYISDLEIAGSDYRISHLGQQTVNAPELSAEQNSVQVSFHAVGAKPLAQFRYRLEGSGDNAWSAPLAQSSLNFANLSPGTYKLIIGSAQENGTVSGKPATLSFVIRPPFWRTWWFIGLSVLVVGGAVFALDRYRVGKTRQVQSALSQTRESEDRFRTLANTASDAIITIDERSMIIFVNEAVEQVFGYKPEEVIGKNMPMLMPERMRGGHDAGLDRYMRKGVKNIDWTGVSLPGLHKDGHEIPLEVSFGEFERDGKRYFTGIARDVSERRRAELALQEARDERLRELERVRTRIATDLHDDIGSSLTQIAVLSEVARSQAANAKIEISSTPLDRIKTVSKELVAVMSDIVWAINPQKDNLNDLVMRMRRFGSDVFSSRGIGFEFAAPGLDREEQMGANIRREVFAIFKESVNNAAKYSECTQVKCELVIDEGWLRLSINDNGKGFDAEEILSDNFRPEMGGNGLVSIRRRANDLGGRCDIWSQMGNGTTIDLNVPLNQLESTIAPNGNGHKRPPDNLHE